MSSEVTRPAAAASSSRGGRGSGRGGRSGFGSRSGRGKAADEHDGSSDSTDGQLNSLRAKHGAKLTVLQEMFSGWSDSDLLSALEEADGDEGRVAELISEGAIEQWHEVQKDVHRPKKESEAPSARPGRGGRATTEGARGRARTAERGGGARAPRGRSQNAGAVNGRSKDGSHQLSVPTEESNDWGAGDSSASAWDTSATKAAWGEGASEPAAAAPAAKPATKPAAAPAEPAKPTWASLLRKPDPPKPAPKPKEAPKPAEPIEPLPPAPAELDATEPEVEAPAAQESEEAKEPEPEPAAAAVEERQPEENLPEPEPEQQQAPAAEPEAEAEPVPEPETQEDDGVPAPVIIEPEIALPPPKDKLTQSNLEQVLDVSPPAVSGTAASTAADSWDPRNASTSAVATPLSVAPGQPPVPKPAATPSSGFATTALKATTERTMRTPSFARRVLDQEEAVRMPGNREVDGAAVQFGAFHLSEDADADEDAAEEQQQPLHRDGEPAETRTQPPADSPVAHPRTALPPSQPAAAPTPAVSDAFAAQKSPSAVPTPAVQAAVPTGPSASIPPPSAPSGPAALQQQQQQQQQHQAAHVPHQPHQPHAPHHQQQPLAAQQPQNPPHFDRFGPPTPTATHDAYQKPFGAFGQQPSAIAAPHQQHQQVDAYPPHQPQSQAQTQANLGSGTSGPSDYSSYATADPHNRNYLYNNYYNNTFHHQAQQDSLGSQARGGFAAGAGGFNAAQDSIAAGGQYPGLHNQSRFGVAADAPNSGHSTPNPAAQSQAAGQPQGQQQGQQGQQPHQQGGGQGGQGYQGYHHLPYMQNQYYAAAYGYPYGAYGGPYNKGYGHPYGGPGGHYEHSPSPAPGFGQTAAHRNDSGPASGGLDSYGRVGGGAQSGAGQPGIGAGAGMGAFGGSAHDAFRSGSYQSQGQGFGSAQTAGNTSGNDDLKPFGGDAKAAHSPAMAGVRPTSAANNAAGQTGLPPPGNAGQGQMGAFGGYPGHLGHLQQSAYGMGSNAGNNPQQGSTPYGGNAGGNGYQGGGFAGGAGGYGGYGNQAHGGHRVGSGWGNNYN
jgi:hypothetical protein